jgi:hypothetical protein
MSDLHALKIENLSYSEQYANQVSDILKSFIEDNFEFLDERIEKIPCRSYSGFMPFSNNKGGWQAFAYGSQLDGYICPTGFKEYDKLCENTYNSHVESICENNDLTLEQWNKGLDEDNIDIIELRDEMEMNYCSDYDSSGIELMLKLENENTLYVYFGIGGQDAPYFRSFESTFDYEIKFDNAFELKKKLNNLLKENDVISIQSELEWRFM